MPKVKVYSTSTCPYCHMAKEFLRQNNVEFEDINVEEDRGAAEEMVRKSGQYGVPVIEVDGEIVVGFDRERLKQLLKI
ncbi:NrdH-redoxin [Candidatus Woesearchaeota archaeon]|nr:glutaredoxin family protein [Candidatus Woesearchaeota archaeon]RLE43429.1 MAG: NrdH-redoxin [Candidatus Woesearchaeota archaeon]